MEKALARSPQRSPVSPARLQQTAGNAAAVRAVRSGGIPTVAWQGEAGGERFLFARGSTDLLPGQQQALRAFARTIPPGFRLTLHGMASEEGPAGFNENLARARAERAVELLSECGVLASRVDVILVHGAAPGDRRLHRAAVVDLTPPPVPEASPTTVEPPEAEKTPSVVTAVAEQVVPSELGVKVDDEVTASYRPMGPVLYRFKLKFSFSGTVKGPWHGTKALFAPGKLKTEFSKGVQSELGKLSLKIDTGGKVGVEWTTKSRLDVLLGGRPVVELSSPIVDVIRGKSQAKKLDFVDVGAGAAWEADLSQWGPEELRLARALPEGVTIPGKISAKLAVGFVPNPVWVARGAAAAAGTEVAAGATALEIAAGVALPVGMVAFVGHGLYQLNEAHLVGRARAMRESFADGYAEVLTQVTEPRPWVPEGAGLLDLDWRPLFEAAFAAHVNGSGPGFAEGSQCRLAGRAAAAQEVLRLIESDPGAVPLLGVRHRTLYGQSTPQRAARYRQILREQARSNVGGEMGIVLTETR